MHNQADDITSFLTDGALAALCAAIGRLAGADVLLIDAEGREVALGDDERPWVIRPAGPHAEALRTALASGGAGIASSADGRFTLMPLIVRGRAIGALTIWWRDSEITVTDRSLLEFAVEMLASTVGEFCEQTVEVNQRHSELRTVFRLSSLLVAARDVGTILHVALRSSMDVFGMDAGSVHLLDEAGERLMLRSQVGLPAAIASGAGMIVVGDAPAAVALSEAGSHQIRSLAQEAGLLGVISVGLMFKQQPIGVLRLYSSELRLLDPEQHALLQAIAEQAAAAVAGAHLMQAERESAAMRRQLELAGDVQRRMLPQTAPNFPTLDIAARYQPSFELSGDFYDLIDLNGHLAVTVGDVSGKGVPAALLMAAARATIRAHSQDVFHLNELMARVNKAMVRDTLPQEFLTVFYGVIDPKKLRMTYCNAGHDPPLVFQFTGGKGGQGERLVDLDVGGMIVGVDAAQSYERGVFDFTRGDVLLASTDGLTDAMNFQGAKFGRARMKTTLVEFLRASPRASAREIADHLIWEVRRFVGMNPQTDDITMVVIRVK